MEDAKREVPTVQWNRSQAYLTNNNFEINGNIKKFDKSSIYTIGGNSQIELVAGSESGSESDEVDDNDSDIISEHIGHIGPYQLFWAFIMCLYQFPTTFHIFCLVFQVSCSFFSKVKLMASRSALKHFIVIVQFQFVGLHQTTLTSLTSMRFYLIRTMFFFVALLKSASVRFFYYHFCCRWTISKLMLSLSYSSVDVIVVKNA
jgi:hypothetical protein